ncbi:hypothetical protein OUZ56_033288 [Daphnia magna]|uniref:Uncharacterized protein n=2 Tax=Daphnia magna TaxID=35525 RepID=A0ABR0BAK2_9CRUS|nr:hypothetical protein OUZ56_033288 [Daphnia magna]
MSPALICPISSAINRKHREPGCAMSLFVKDEARSRTQCTTHVSPWLGQQTVYLGHRRWGYSTTEDTTITITCPQSREKVNTLIRRKPFDVFEVPMSCTAHLDNWIFQASFRKNVKYTLNNASLPSLTELEKVGQVLKAPEASETILEREGGTRTQKSQPILTRRAMIQGRVALMGEHLRIIEEEEKARRGAGQPETVRYPFELVAVIAILFFGLGASLFVYLRQTGATIKALTQRIVELEGRLTIHEAEVEELRSGRVAG